LFWANSGRLLWMSLVGFRTGFLGEEAALFVAV